MSRPRSSYPYNRTTSSSTDMSSLRGNEVLGAAAAAEERVFVTVGKEVKSSKSTVNWALQNTGGKKISLLYVHQPVETISVCNILVNFPFFSFLVLINDIPNPPKFINLYVCIYIYMVWYGCDVVGGKFPLSSLAAIEVEAIRAKEKQEMTKLLNEYVRSCSKAGVTADIVDIEMAVIEKGIVELVNQHRIRRLVMGAASDGKYSRKMIQPKSKKANYVRQQAPLWCHIWFVCKGRLIYTREGCDDDQQVNSITTVGDDNNNNNNVLIPSSSVSSSHHLHYLYHPSVPPLSPGPGSPSPSSTSGFSTPSWSRSVAGESSSNFNDRSSTASAQTLSVSSDQPSTPYHSRFSSSPCVNRIIMHPDLENNDDDAITTRPRNSNAADAELIPIPSIYAPSSVDIMNDGLYDQLQQAMAESESAKRQAFEESLRRTKAEKDALDSVRKASFAESAYFEELRRRKEVENELSMAKEELATVKRERDEMLDKFKALMDGKSQLENRVERSDAIVKQMEQSFSSTWDLFKQYMELQQ